MAPILADQLPGASIPQAHGTIQAAGVDHSRAVLPQQLHDPRLRARKSARAPAGRTGPPSHSNPTGQGHGGWLAQSGGRRGSSTPQGMRCLALPKGRARAAVLTRYRDVRITGQSPQTLLFWLGAGTQPKARPKPRGLSDGPWTETAAVSRG